MSKPEIRIVDMRNTAAALMKRVAGTKGIFVFVGWGGEAIGVGDIRDVRKTLPHERVNITPAMTYDEILLELRLAAARLVEVLPDAIAKMKRSPPKPKGLFTKPALYKRRR